MEIAPTTFWSAKIRPACARALRDAELGPKIEALWEKNYSVYERRKLAKAARKAGLDVGRDQVARLMRQRGTASIRGGSIRPELLLRSQLGVRRQTDRAGPSRRTRGLLADELHLTHLTSVTDPGFERRDEPI